MLRGKPTRYPYQLQTRDETQWQKQSSVSDPKPVNCGRLEVHQQLIHAVRLVDAETLAQLAAENGNYF